MWSKVAVVTVVVAASIIAVGHAAATLPADVEVSNASCANGNVSSMTLDVDYRGDRAIESSVRVWTQRDRVRMSWGTPLLKPGQNRIQIHAPSRKAVLQYGERGQVMVNVGQMRAYEDFRSDSICR